jgi:hypothetical protein
VVKFGSIASRSRIMFLLSTATSLLLVVIFLSGAFLSNITRGEIAYTQVDMAAGSIFVFVITMIIALSLWPRVADWFENREKDNKISH